MSASLEPGRGASRIDALRAPLAAAALLVFLWPVVRTPRLSLLEASGHLFASWALLIVGLYAISRAGPKTP